MFGLEKFNPFKKQEAPKEVESDVVVEEEKKEIVQKPALSLEEELALVEEKKKEIEDLSQKRQDFHIYSRDLEEKILMSGITKEKAQEIREKIMEESGEIGDQIQAIRDEFNIVATPVEVYSARLEMIEKEINRIRNNRAPEYQVISTKINSFFGEGNDSIKRQINSRNGQVINLFLESVSKENKDIAEVDEFLKEMVPLNKYDAENDNKIYQEVVNLKNKINEKIKENTTYKTSGEDREAQIRLEKLVSLSDKIYKVLKDAKNKEGQFEKPNSKYF